MGTEIFDNLVDENGEAVSEDGDFWYKKRNSSLNYKKKLFLFCANV